VSSEVAILVTVAGIAVILVSLRDVFDALFHPGGKATISLAIMRGVWRAFAPIAKRRSSAISLAGPTALILIVAFWATALVVGWALIFWPHIDGGFNFQPGTEHRGAGGLVDSIYVSVVTLGTVGYGDVTPADAWLRIVTPLEALIGFGLLTASISWLGMIYPALQRRRSLAYEIHLMREAQRETGVEVAELDPAAAASVYGEFTSRLVTVERDLVAFPISYYFVPPDDRFSLAASAPYLYALALQGADDGVDARARMRAVMLRDAIRDFADTVAKRFHRRSSDDVWEELDAFARDHARTGLRPTDRP
jgi:hypothetical protein